MKNKCIITSGPTREYLDPIRFLSNPSTGRMGYSIANAAVTANMQTSYIIGPVQKEFSSVDGAKNISVVSTNEMLNTVLEELNDIDEYSCVYLIMSAAPADYRPKVYSHYKIKKTNNPVIELVQNPDILLEVSKYQTKYSFKNLKVIGFAAETNNAEEYAINKLIEKNLDAIFLNNLSDGDSGFASITNQLTLFTKEQKRFFWEHASKKILGKKIIEYIIKDL